MPDPSGDERHDEPPGDPHGERDQINSTPSTPGDASSEDLKPSSESSPAEMAPAVSRSASPQFDPAILESLSRRAMPQFDPAILESLSRRAMPQFDPAIWESLSRRAMPQFDPAILESLTRRAIPQFDPAVLEALLRYSSALNKPEKFERRPHDQRRFSPQLVRPSQIFEATEEVISSHSELVKAVDRLRRKNPGLPLVWRGQQDASWGLHSSLYRVLMKELSVELPEGTPVSTPQRFPSEDDMVAAERALFQFMRQAWRMDNVPGLELLARLQHHGGPTRYLDVTRNPLMALWFAVEPSDRTQTCDARLFAIANQPALPGGAPKPSRYMDAPLLTQAAVPFWMDYASNEERRLVEWGTGTQRRVWIPPAYDDRIAAQNAAFLLEGLPLPSEELLEAISKASESEFEWRWADLAAAACFYVLPARASRKLRPRAHRLAPVFTFRIPAAVKDELWNELTERWGLLPGVVYPDIQGLGQYLRQGGDWVSKALSAERDSGGHGD